MEPWEITKERAQITLPIWETHTPTLTIGELESSDLETMIDGYEPLVQARTDAQDVFDAANRAVAKSLSIMKTLSLRVPAIIEAQLSENEGIMDDVDDVQKVIPRSEPTILKRARILYPVWVRANAALAALETPQPPIKRVIAGVEYTAALLKGQLDGFTNLVKTMRDKKSDLKGAKLDLAKHDKAVDQLIKRWYKNAKASAEVGSDLEAALEDVPTEEGTPAPEVIEIDAVTQGGEGGLEVLVTYVAGGGAHATTKLVRWRVGAGTDYPNSEALEAGGNALEPFTVGRVVTIITAVTNSTGTRTVAPRTITIETPI
jgi:hypothetical protein